MTIKDAIQFALDDWSLSADFDINNSFDHIVDLIETGIDDWAEAHGYEFDEELCIYVKGTAQ